MSKSEQKSNKEKRKPKTAEKSKSKTPAYLRGAEKPISIDLKIAKNPPRK